MDTHALLDGAEDRIARNRRTGTLLRFVGPGGAVLPGVTARVRLARHAFKLGCNGFLLTAVDDRGLQQAYRDRFAALLNYATLPFYWGGYEPEPGGSRRDRLVEMAEWCRDNSVTAKGHPLVWHEVFPQWAGSLPDAEVLQRQEARVRSIVADFAGLIDIWDVVNEATVSHRFDNAVGRWIKANGAAHCVAAALAWAHDASPDAVLLYNDFNVGEDFESLARRLLDDAAPVRTLGIQSHMHKELWRLERAWNVCETYARFGLPLHFTELTVLSGRLKAENDNDWHKRHDDWLTAPEGERAQADYGEQLYTLLFSHPAVEAVTWWDFSDFQSWQGAPAGLLRPDMSPKPLYDRLYELFHKRWTTDVEITADADGRAHADCFYGDYAVDAAAPSGDRLKGRFTLPPQADSVTVVLE
ncbi:MAG: endo-1,4-beta-xylanase [Planctomycetes bacterium]|nr:endo-1,4-beta-xylanase [Planctomycetota bacterium]